MADQDNQIKSTKKTFRILNALKQHNGATVTDLTDELGLPQSSVHNYLRTLKNDEYIVQDSHGQYHIGLRFLDLGGYARKRQSIYEVTKPEIQKLADKTGELANLLTEEHGRGIYLNRQSGEQAVKVDSYTGQRVYLHNTALGKAILAHLPRERTDAILDTHGMPATTDKTITDRDQLYEELETIREDGVAFDDQERISGLRCVAVPIIGQNDSVKGAISLSGPLSRIGTDRFRTEFPKRLKDTVNIVELNVTYS